MQTSAFATNLRLLCTYKQSIADVCRDLCINRSQFNRYLSGGSAPRAGLMRKLCDYFGIELHEALLPADEFEDLIRVRGVQDTSPAREVEQHVGQLLQACEGGVTNLRGMFFEYYYSMSVPGEIMRSLVTFQERDGMVVYRRLERIGRRDQPCHKRYRHYGLAVMLGQRYFLTDYEDRLKVELTQTILYPDYSGQVRRLAGLKVGVSANAQRTPCCVRVCLDRAPSGSTLIGNLKLCGTYPGDSPEIPAEVKAAIDNRQLDPHVHPACIAN